MYVANIVDEEQPSWQPPEGDPQADAESDDEGGAAAGASGGDAEGNGDDSAEGAGDDADAAAADGQDAGGSGSSGSTTPDYASKLLRYVAASTGQKFVTAMELRRPKPAEDGSAEQQQPQHAITPVTFRILDERMPLLEVKGLVHCCSMP